MRTWNSILSLIWPHQREKGRDRRVNQRFPDYSRGSSSRDLSARCGRVAEVNFTANSRRFTIFSVKQSEETARSQLNPRGCWQLSGDSFHRIRCIRVQRAPTERRSSTTVSTRCRRAKLRIPTKVEFSRKVGRMFAPACAASNLKSWWTVVNLSTSRKQCRWLSFVTSICALRYAWLAIFFFLVMAEIQISLTIFPDLAFQSFQSNL